MKISRVSLFQVRSLGPTIVAAVVVETGLQVLSVGSGEKNVCQMTASICKHQYLDCSETTIPVETTNVARMVARMVAMVAICCSLQPPAVIGKTTHPHKPVPIFDRERRGV